MPPTRATRWAPAWAGLLAAALAAGGCAAPARDDPAPAPTPGDARAVRVEDGRTGDTVPWDELLRRAADADVVLLGEVHGHPLGLAFEEALNRDLLDAHPDTYALSMEFLERDDQLALDDLGVGLAPDPDPLARASLPDAHRRMARAVADAGRPVIAANAPRRYVTMIRKQGRPALDRLTPEQRRLVVVPGDLNSGDYRDRFFALMGGMMAAHGGGHAGGEQDHAPPDDRAIEAMVTPYFLAQNVWDATMADSIARAADAGARPVLHVVGRFHTDHEGGLTERLRALRPATRLLTISLAPADDQGGDLPEPSAPLADLIVHLD